MAQKLAGELSSIEKYTEAWVQISIPPEGEVLILPSKYLKVEVI